MVRILQIIGSLNMGGAENFIVNIYRNIDRSLVQFDFVLYDKPQGNNFYEEVENLGAKIYYVPPKKEGMIKNYRAIRDIVRENNYKTVWKHTSHCFAGIDIIAAKSGGATKRILHSHNKGTNKLETKLHYVFRPIVNMFATDRFACSNEAGEWLFGNRPFKVINNGIDLERFRYRVNIRQDYRKKFGLEDKFVIGHIGRFELQKNHSFMIDVFHDFCKKEDRAVLVLIGEGSLQDEIKEQVKSKDIDDKVLFLNTRFDIAELLQMMDVFMMPSNFEGFGIALLEAQAVGMPCLASDQVPNKANVTGKVKYLPLGNVELWADTLQKIKNEERIENAVELIREAGYSITDIARDIESMILSIED